MHHICAYSASQNPGANVEADVPAVADASMTIQNGHFLPQRPIDLIFWGAAAATLTKARLSSPTLAVITTPFLRDINVGTSMGVPMRFADQSQDRIKLTALEELILLEAGTAAVAEQRTGFLGLMIQDVPQPAGTVFTIRGTAAGTLVANTWSNVGPITWTNNLPTGLYSIVGGSFFSAGCLAGRFIIENWPWRPGGFGVQALGNMTDRLFRNGNLGTWGQFHSYGMPQVEIFSGSADTSEEITMDIQKIQ